MDNTQHPSVTETVWPWRQPAPTPHRPGPLRVLLQACIPLGIAAFFYLKPPFAHARTASYIIGGIGLTLLLLGLFLPRAFARVERLVFALVGWIGIALSWLEIAPLYYSFFTLAHLFMAIRGKDPLHRKLDPSAASYWTVREPITDPAAHCRRQF